MNTSPRAISKKSKVILDRLISGLGVGGLKKVDNAPGTFMALHVSILVDTPAGIIVALAHYFEQNDDLVPDPQMELLRGADGEWIALSWTNQFGRRTSAVVEDGRLVVTSPSSHADQTRFANTWLKNIKIQQGVGGKDGALREGLSHPRRE